MYFFSKYHLYFINNIVQSNVKIAALHLRIRSDPSLYFHHIPHTMLHTRKYSIYLCAFLVLFVLLITTLYLQ